MLTLRGVTVFAIVTLLTGTIYSQAPVPVITLQDALERARHQNVEYLAAQTEAKIAREDRFQARAALLPSVAYNNQFIYTQGRGADVPRFIANNATHEYISQANAHESLNLGLGEVADFRRAGAAEALAKARAEIATRGLVVTVVSDYYALVADSRKLLNTRTAAAEAQRFLDLSLKLENGGEVAHSDVIKAQLQYNDQVRSLREAQLAEEKAKLALAVIIFPNFRQDFTVADDLSNAPEVPAIAEVQRLAGIKNPELRAAAAAERVAAQEVATAWSAHFPSLTLDYFYGIDAAQFATRGPDGIRNLGYAATATLNIPVSTWGATQSKVRQAQYRHDQARVELSAAQRELMANMQTLYSEVEAAHGELESLKSSVNLATESVRLTTLRYQAGEATVLEVVDAQNTLISARNLLDDGAARYRIALANLQTLTGKF